MEDVEVKTNGGGEYVPGEMLMSAEPPIVQANGLTDASAYQMGVSYHEWKPMADNPNYIVKLWLMLKRLKGSDQTAIQNKVNQIDLDNQNVNRLRQQLAHLRPDARVDRNEAKLRSMSADDDEWKDKEDTYYSEREKLQGQIDGWMSEYANKHEAMQGQIKTLLANPSFYQTLRSELFAKVIHDHTIGLPDENGSLFKVDFNSNDPSMELSDDYAAGLQEFIWDCLKKARAGKNKSAQFRR